MNYTYIGYHKPMSTVGQMKLSGFVIFDTNLFAHECFYLCKFGLGKCFPIVCTGLVKAVIIIESKTNLNAPSSN